MVVFFKKLLSYFFSLEIKSYESTLNGKLTVAYENGKMVLNSAKANYSFGGLHTIFKEALRLVDLLHVKKVLILGLGAGSIVQLVREKNKTASIDAVEADPLIIAIGKEFFNLGRYSGLTIFTEDVFKFFKKKNETYDLITVDIFIDDKVPEEIFTNRFFSALKSCCHAGSLIIFNASLPRHHQTNETEHIAAKHFASVEKKYICKNQVYFIKNPS